LIGSKLPATIELSLFALLIAFVLGTWIGTRSALKPGSWFDALGQIVSMAGVSIPVFWLGMMVMSLFAGEGDWFEVGAWGPEKIGPGIDYSTAFTLATIPLATITRMTRSSVLEEASKDYVTTARAKGLSERRVIRHHVRRNALIPVVTITGLQLGVLLSGAVLTERVFSWPGLGTEMVEAAGMRDYPVIMGCMLFFVIVFVVVNLIVDVLYLWIDPRMRTAAD
ncbi:MAG: ABC transporter permease, partial [Planctomycetota bacterium]|nr:ABC transporter permease [Planctomycetota bacterium]